MAGRQPIPTTLPAYRPQPGWYEAEQIEKGRTLREARAKVPPDEWEGWLRTNYPDDEKHNGFMTSFYHPWSIWFWGKLIEKSR